MKFTKKLKLPLFTAGNDFFARHYNESMEKLDKAVGDGGGGGGTEGILENLTLELDPTTSMLPDECSVEAYATVTNNTLWADIAFKYPAGEDISTGFFQPAFLIPDYIVFDEGAAPIALYIEKQEPKQESFAINTVFGLNGVGDTPTTLIISGSPLVLDLSNGFIDYLSLAVPCKVLPH